MNDFNLPRDVRCEAGDLAAEAFDEAQEEESLKQFDFSEFFMLLGAAQYAAKEVDYFDLHSADPASEREFKDLCQEQRKTSTALVKFAQKYGDEIIKAFKDKDW